MRMFIGIKMIYPDTKLNANFNPLEVKDDASSIHKDSKVL